MALLYHCFFSLANMFKAASTAHFLPEMGFSSYTEANNTINQLNEAFQTLPTIHKKIIEVKKIMD